MKMTSTYTPVRICSTGSLNHEDTVQVPRPRDFVIKPRNVHAPGPAFGTWESMTSCAHGASYVRGCHSSLSELIRRKTGELHWSTAR
jgi:hypothetical protein